MKSTENITYYKYDRRISITKEGEDRNRFEFDKSVQRMIRREKRITHRAVRRTERAEILAHLIPDYQPPVGCAFLSL